MSEDVFATDQDGDNQSPIEALVGPDKKFKTVDDLAKGKLEADNFIEQLKSEKQQAMEALEEAQKKGESQATVADLIKAVREGQNSNEEGKPDLDPEELEKKIRDIMRGETEQQTAARNRSKGNELVLNKVGGDVEAAKLYVAERAKQLSVTPEYLAELSEKSPDAFAKLIDANPSTAQTKVTQVPGVNTSAMGNAGTTMQIDGHNTKTYYDQKKAEMGIFKYLNDTRLQNQLLKDAMALGERFNKP